MNAKLIETSEYSVTSKDEEYIGSVDSDDYETVDFTIECTGNSADLKLELEYMDANNVGYTDEEIIPLKIKQAKNGGSYKVGIIIVLVIVGVGI